EESAGGGPPERAVMHRLAHGAEQRVDEDALQQQRRCHPPRAVARQHQPAARNQQAKMKGGLGQTMAVGLGVEPLQDIGRHYPHLAGALAGYDKGAHNPSFSARALMRSRSWVSASLKPTCSPTIRLIDGNVPLGWA